MAATEGEDKRCLLNEQLDFLPDKLLRRLMPFQKEGVVFATKHDGKCLIADEMGLGKTLQALSTAYYYRDAWPLLIVVPSSMRYPWVEEVEKWFPEIDPSNINVILSGSDISGIANTLITIVTYGLLRSPTSHVLQEALLTQEFKIIIVDESHYMKNRKSATSKYLVPLLQQSKHKILLTGTPALARPEELFPQVDAISPGSFGTWSAYAKKYCNAHWQYFGRNRKRWVTDGASNLEELQSLLCYHGMIRRLKKDVLKQLPPKQRQRITFPVKDSPLKKDLDLAWDELDRLMKQGQTSLTSVLSHTQTEVAAENSSFAVHALISTIYRKTATVKIGPVKEYVKMLGDNQGLKFLVFAHHHVMMDSIAEQLHDDKIKYIRIDGNTDQAERPRLVHEFQVDPSIRVAILSIKAAGVGLTLTAAQLVVFAELDWTPGVLEQCEDRAHRIGQKQMVHIHYLIAKGTIDEWVWSALARKTTVVTTTLNGKRQVLRVDEGDSRQVECLANADAWVPTQKHENEEQDIGAFFKSQQLPKNQRSMLEYFTPKSKTKVARTCGTKSPRRPTKLLEDKEYQNSINSLDKSEKEFSESRKRKMPIPLVNKDTGNIVVIDSDSDSDFHTPPTKRRPCGSNSKTSSPKTPKSQQTPKSDRTSRLFKDTSTPVGMRSGTSASTPQLSPLVTMGSACKESGSAGGVVSRRRWSCKACTFLNHEALPFCEMCSSPAPGRKIGTVKSAKPDPKSHDDSDFVGCWDISNDLLQGSNDSLSLNDSGEKISSLGKDCRDKNRIQSECRLSNHDDRLAVECTGHGGGCDVTEYNDITTEGDSRMDNESCGNAITCDNSQVTSPVRTREVIERATPVSPPTAGNTDHEIITKEMAEAVRIFSPKFKKASQLSISQWTCPGCQTVNDIGDDFCDCCLQNKTTETVEEVKKTNNLSDRSKVNKPAERVKEASDLHSSISKPSENHTVAIETRAVDLDQVPTFSRLQFCCSKNTSRVYLYDENGESLDVNFIPLDVDMENFPALPDLLLHPHNLRLVKRFIREWNSLAPTKRRLIVKSGQVFSNPCLLYDDLKKGRVSSKMRFTTKAAVASAALSKAEEINGTVQIVRRPTLFSPKSTLVGTAKVSQRSPGGKRPGMPGTSTRDSSPGVSKSVLPPSGGDEKKVTLPESEEEIEKMRGIVQAVAADGTPLCIYCQEPYQNPLVSKKTVQQHAWATRFCSQHCAEQYWIRRDGSYSKKQVFEAERGICQLCGVDANQFFERIRITKDHGKRAQLIQESTFSSLNPKVKERMVRQPTKGMFWQADHITAVSAGGGQCDIDNLRTLCTPCHQGVTAEQNRQRAVDNRRRHAASTQDITLFFQPT